MMKTNEILGSVELPNGEQCDITPMNALFLDYLFNDRAEWETLRRIVNIMLAEYKMRYHDKPTGLLEGALDVATQYDNYTNAGEDILHDFFIGSNDGGKVTRVEFLSSYSPAHRYHAIRAFNRCAPPGADWVYTQIWLVDQGGEEYLKGRDFASFSRIEKDTGVPHPNPSSMLYISLNSLSESDNQAGSLAAFLLGKNLNPSDGDVKAIADRFVKKFAAFKDDAEVKQRLMKVEDGNA